MRRVKLSMPSPAMVVACLALVAALGGTAYAALGKNSVTSKQIAPKAVKSSDISNGAVTAKKLKAAAIRADAIAAGAIGTDKLADASVTGSKLGPLSVKLANLGVKVDSFFQDTPLPDDGTRVNSTATCPAGGVAVTGGFSFAGNGPLDADDFTGDFHVIQSRANISDMGNGFPDQGSGFDSWRVTAVNEPGGNTGAATLTSMVVCLLDR
jgi:hypothetical protein